MKLEMSLSPTDEQVELLRALPRNTPFWMISLLKYRSRAVYEDGVETSLSGREVYALYADALEPIINAAGGRLVAMGDFLGLFIGKGDLSFDVATVVEFPDVDVWFQTLGSKQVEAISVHRRAGLEKQALFLVAPKTSIIG